ncbi:MAG: cis-L-3-hydroxyproline dehydratase [Gaiellales bacterium]|jgi:L-alanine-DL-glutamate epimerase-like enolase superfamily enzyme|nr:cis-L-3-hydroxyproline dehydratase [Gaiellales bacterium]
MRIARVAAYRQLQPFRDGPYTCRGQSEDGTDATIVVLQTDDGFTGAGEMAPLGAFYAPAFAAATRVGVAELAPLLVGADPRHPQRVRRMLDTAMLGQPAVKSAIDMAVYDLAARAAGVPLCAYLGGRHGSAVALYRAVSQNTPAAMAVAASAYVAAGYRRIQVKVGGDPEEDVERVHAVRATVPGDVVLFCDANGAWTTAQARAFLRATRDLEITVEQPCMSYDDCRSLRAACPHPLVLDECIDSLPALLAAHRDGVADGVTIKIARVGGVGPAALMRDVAVTLGLPVTVEDTGGSDIDTAAMAHLSLSTPEELRIHTVDFNAWVTVGNATGMPPAADGRLTLPDGPGLGVDARIDVLGEPFGVWDAGS